MRALGLSLLVCLPAAAAPALDGVYIVDRPEGVVVFELRGGEVEFAADRTLSWKGTYARTDEVLTFTFEHTTVRTTWALVDGVLWLGAMVPDPRGPDRWMSLHERNTSMSPKLPMEGPEEAVLDEHAGVWMHRESGREATAARRLVKRAPVSDGFWPVVEGAMGAEGFLRHPSCSDAACVASHTRYQGRPFIQKGAVILAPWSVAVGRPGLVPARLPAKQLMGRWSVPGGPGVVFAETPDARRGDDFRDVPEPRQLAVRDGVGIYVEHWGRNCMMNHLDVPSTSVFVVLGQSRVLVHTREGTHHVARSPRADVLLRRQGE